MRTRQCAWNWHQEFASFYLGKSKKSKGCLAAPWEICPTLGNPSWGRPWTPQMVQGLPKAATGSQILTQIPVGPAGKRGKTPAKPCCDEGFVSTGLELGATSGFPVCCGDPSVHPQPERGPGWLEQDRQGQECSQGHCHTSPGTGSSRGTAPRSLSAPTPPWLPSMATGTFHGQLAAPALSPELPQATS